MFVSLRRYNEGHQMLAKMGWSDGQGLGAAGGGIIVPVRAADPMNDQHIGGGVQA